MEPQLSAATGDGGGLDEQVDAPPAALQQLRRDVELLEIENELLEEYVSQAEQQGIVTQSPAKKPKSARRRKAGEPESSKQQQQQQDLPKLTEDERADLVNQAVEELQDAIQKTRASGEKDVDDIRTLMEEVDLRIKETKQQTYEFKRDVILGAEDARTGRTNADKVLRFFQDTVHDKGVLIEKLNLKNSTFRAAIAKLEAQLAHKEEMGEVLHLVDYEQLKIENQQYLERIDAKNRELLALKLSTGKTVQLLNDAKDALARLIGEGDALQAALTARQRELDGFEADYSRTASQAASATAGFKALAAQQKDAEQPQILDYIKLKAQVGELEREAGDLQRKLEVAQAAAAAATAAAAPRSGASPGAGSGGGISARAARSGGSGSR